VLIDALSIETKSYLELRNDLMISEPVGASLYCSPQMMDEKASFLLI